MIKQEKTREEVLDIYKWDLSSIYKNEKEYLDDCNTLKALLKDIQKFKGHINDSSNSLYNFLVMDDKISYILTNLYVYANSMKDQDVMNQENSKRYNEILSLASLVSEATSFIVPEMLGTDYEVIKKYIEQDDRLKEFTFDLNDIYKYQKHVVDEKTNILLSNISDLDMGFEQNTETITNGIIKYGTIEDENSDMVEITNGNISKYLKSPVRRVRKDAFLKRIEKYKEYENVLAINYENHLKADSYVALTKKYRSTLEMYLFSDDVTVDVYDSLLKFAKANLGTLHKYYKLKKKALGLDTFYDYDIRASILDEKNHKFSFEDGKDMILKALGVYGDKYIDDLSKAFSDHWIDVYPNKGKRSGFYSTSCGKGNPIILANFTEDYYGVSALAHELGHSMHSYYSSKNNPFHLSEYTILVAEVASLTNEILLANYILENSSDKELKKLAIYNMLEFMTDNFFGTVASGSIFEKEVHERIDNKETIGITEFISINKKIMDDYYGDVVERSVSDNPSCLYVPHYYNSFYYYKYAVGIVGACYVATKILSGDKEYLNKYLKFLSLGGSMSPLDELKSIDIDFTNEEILSSCVSYMNSLIERLDNLINEE